jgi:hypothetical protein
MSRTEPDTGREAAVSAEWGRQLLDNPVVRVEAPARAVLQDGQADARALLVLAVLAARHPVHVLDLPAVSGEDPACPDTRSCSPGSTRRRSPGCGPNARRSPRSS